MKVCVYLDEPIGGTTQVPICMLFSFLVICIETLYAGVGCIDRFLVFSFSPRGMDDGSDDDSEDLNAGSNDSDEDMDDDPEQDDIARFLEHSQRDGSGRSTPERQAIIRLLASLISRENDDNQEPSHNIRSIF